MTDKSQPLRDLQHRIDVDGRAYLIGVYAPGNNLAPISGQTSDAQILVHLADTLADRLTAEPEHVVCSVVEYVWPLIPPSVTREQWEKFVDAVLAWVCARNAEAAKG